MFGLPIPDFLIRPIACLLAAAALLLLGRAWGQHAVYQEWIAANEEARIAAVKIIEKQDRISERVVIQYRDRIHEVQTAADTVTREIPVYVPPAADPLLPLGWRLLHDASAAARAVSPPAGGADVATPDARASEALTAVSHNYAACNANAVQLKELQGWVRSQYETTNQRRLVYGADPP